MSAAALALVACASGDERSPAPPPPQAPPAAVAPSWFPAPLPPPDFPADILSLELDRSIAVRFEPSPSAKNLGTVAAHTRVRWKRTQKGRGCAERWVEIEPRGWICEVYLRPSRQPAAGVELPRLGWDELVPGEYGKVKGEGAKTFKLEHEKMVVARELAGAATVRRYSEMQVGKTLYWSIGGGEYLPADHIARHEPTAWSGVRLGDASGWELAPDGGQSGLGFAIAKDVRAAVPTWSQPVGGARVRQLPRRTPLRVLETATDAAGAPTAYRVSEREWIRAEDLRAVRSTPPPPLTQPGERWFDVDLDSQILVAYEGETPVYATVVTTGKKTTPTQTGIFRIWIKFAETDMNGQMGDEAPYSVATVPWTQFYAKDFALHTAYWHDRFGARRSHGCINLAPTDARFLYFWSSPDVPAGWSMAHGVAERPGSMVRIHSAEDPDPEFKGYAKVVQEKRVEALSATSRTVRD